MMKKKWNKVLQIAIGILVVGSMLTGCGPSSKEEKKASKQETIATDEKKAEETISESTVTENTKEETKEVRKLVFAYTATGVPYTYTDESGKATGSDIEILRLIDEKLTDYEFEFVATSYDDIYIGLQSGTYDAGLTNSFFTIERNEKYLIPEENLGGCLAGLLVRKENEAVKTLEDVATNKLRLVPMVAGNGMTYQIETYNEANSDNQIPIEYTSDTESFNLALGWVGEGKYDVASVLKTAYEKTIVADDGAYHQYNDNLSFTVYKTIKTYPMFSRVTLDDSFVQLFSETLKAVKADGSAGSIATEFYGEDIFKYTYTEGR